MSENRTAADAVLEPALFWLDRRMVLVAINSLAADVLGIPAAQCIGKRLAEFLVHEELVDVNLPLRGEPERVRSFPIRFKRPLAGGVEEVPGALTLHSLEGAAGKECYLGVFFETSYIPNSLPHLGGVRVDAAEFTGHLVRGASHKLNNVFTVFSGYCELLSADETLDAGFADAVAQMRSAAETGANLVERFLQIGTRVSIQFRWSAPSEIINMVLTRSKTTLPAGIHVQLDDNCAPGLKMRTDPNRVADILLELLSNASDALGGSGKTLLQCQQDPATGMATFQVIDRGDGIAVTDDNLIYVPFFSRRKNLGRFGLGLTCAKNLATSLKAELSLIRDEPQGTCFRLIVPKE